MVANIMLLIFLPSHFLKLKYNMGRIDEKLRKTEKMTEQWILTKSVLFFNVTQRGSIVET